ncbi:DNA primase small subunit [Archaeoglobus veneficus]|uniref:DNA primase small subunit n=1 Tax=Archaeoglobus veneficus (strain DSM 11195 / SNP6) TaxID=693661 RepID=F2KP20_ARCVS|nr:DNA primase small subunit [Archaeoglobus veneficus]AEA46328.1 DNA primase small subunit [Archaeoglobus veneficus SNP6]
MAVTYEFPEGMRIANLDERRVYYETEFNLKAVAEWLSFRGSEEQIKRTTAFAFIVGRHTGVYLPEFEEIKNKVVVVDNYEGFEDLKDYILRYLPEGVYYDRNVYISLEECRKCEKCYRECWNCSCFVGQELAFDIDPENVECPVHGTLEDKMKRGQGLSFCMYEFDAVREATLRLWEELEKEFEDMRVVFSGRGFHIHVIDEEAIRMSYTERKEISRKFSSYPIDEWVTTGGSRLIRLPYSLNALVSRIVTPLKIEDVLDFDPRYDRRCIPRFLGRDYAEG